jgi:hypothetical protein
MKVELSHDEIEQLKCLVRVKLDKKSTPALEIPALSKLYIKLSLAKDSEE